MRYEKITRTTKTNKQTNKYVFPLSSIVPHNNVQIHCFFVAGKFGVLDSRCHRFIGRRFKTDIVYSRIVFADCPYSVSSWGIMVCRVLCIWGKSLFAPCTVSDRAKTPTPYRTAVFPCPIRASFKAHYQGNYENNHCYDQEEYLTTDHPVLSWWKTT